MLTRVAALEAPHLRIMSLSPGTVATDMQRTIRDSGINPVSQLDWDAHIPPDWPARALAWMCTPDADAWVGQEVSLRDDGYPHAVGAWRMITLEQADGLWTITLNRPDKANSLTAEMLERCARSPRARPAGRDHPDRRGAVFSAGADLDAARAGLATSPLWEQLSGQIARCPA